MTKLATMFENSHRLVLTAAEEAQRFGHPAVDVGHLFLAVAVSQTDAGRALRACGVTLDEARRAVHDEHAHRVALLGISDVRVPPRRPIPSSGPGDIKWNERALSLFSNSGGDGTAATLLHALIDEPRELVVAVLKRLDVDPDTLISASKTAGARDLLDSATASSNSRRVVYRAFIPARRGQVWEMLDSPERRPEWDTAVDTIKPAGPHRWIGPAPADSRTRWRPPWRVKTRIIALVKREDAEQVEWEITFPQTRTGRSERLTIELTDEPGGTGLTLALRPAGTRRWGPRTRFLAVGELTRIASGISLAFRA